ncbi:MAG: hypothetical protein QXD12_04140 [Candidatus Nezhaarchaeales archaeon]
MGSVRKNEDTNLHVVEAKRAIRDFMSKLDRMSSRGELNSDGVKALTRIVRMLNKSGMRDDARRLSKKLKKRGELESILSLLYQLEEKIS